MVYIMVTHFLNHWDKLSNGRARYSKTMLRGVMKKERPVENTKTLFIKVEESTGKLERVWLGKTRNFQEKLQGGKEVIGFEVEIEKEVYENLDKYSKYSEGWYQEDELVPTLLAKNIFDPGFFDILKRTENWDDFERYSFCLLKLLGLHEIYKFPPEHQAGKADGFFVFKNLAVLFDSTLKGDFEETKDTQIDNYCSQLRGGILKHNFREFSVGQHAKQVWIITKGMNSRIIKVRSAVTVKEVGVGKLMEIYRRRLEENLNEEALEKLFQEI